MNTIGISMACHRGHVWQELVIRSSQDQFDLWSYLKGRRFEAPWYPAPNITSQAVSKLLKSKVLGMALFV